LLYNDNLDVLLITESWLDDTFTSGLLDPECKFSIYRKDRNRHGGGVFVFVSKVLRSSEVHIDERFNQLEMLCFDVLFVIYRPPGADATSVNYIDGVIQCLSSYCLLNRVNIVTGDLNCPKINWLTSSCPNDSINRPLLDCITEYGFAQIVDFRTRQWHVLDIVLIDEMQRVLFVTERPPLSYSDHS